MLGTGKPNMIADSVTVSRGEEHDYKEKDGGKIRS